MKETKWDCRFYKDDTTCTALIRMVCKEKDCNFYRGLNLEDVASRRIKGCDCGMNPCECCGKPVHIKLFDDKRTEHIFKCERCGKETKAYSSKRNAMIAWEKGRIQ